MKKTFLSKEIRNAGWIVGEQIFQMALTFVISVISARYLGPANHGLINYTASFISFVTSIATLGMDGVVLNKMIIEPNREGEYLGSAIGFRIVSAIFCSISVVTIVSILNPNDKLILNLVLLQSIQLLFRAFYILDMWFQRYLKSKYVSLAKMIACCIVSFCKVWLLVDGKDCRWFAFSNSLSTIIISMILLGAYIKLSDQRLNFSRKTGANILSESYHFILSGLMTAIYGQIDKMMLGGMISATSVGLYSIASGICNMWIFIPLAIINSIRPSILSLKNKGDEEQYMHRLMKLYSGIIWLCILVAVAIFLVGDFAIKTLYGEAYIGATRALKILIWSEVFSMIGMARGIWILAEKRNEYVKYYLGIGAIVNLVLNFLLIPKFGIEGASFATLITQICTSLVAPLFFKNTRIHTVIVLKSITYFCRKERIR